MQGIRTLVFLICEIYSQTKYEPSEMRHSQPNLQSGGLHAEYKDYTTMYLYLLESFQNLSTRVGGKGALGALKYILLCNVMLNLVSRLCWCCCLHLGTFIGYFFY
jgi:hypothetical protein